MFPVERTPHAKRAAQVRRTMAEMYEDPKEKEKQVGHKTPAPNQPLSLSLYFVSNAKSCLFPKAEDRARYGEELRQQMVEQRAQRQRQRDALKKADEYYYQRAQAQANNKNNSGGAQQQQQQQQQQRRVEASTSQATLRRPVPHVPSLVGHSQIREIQQQQQRAAPRINQLDRLQEYPWQVSQRARGGRRRLRFRFVFLSDPLSRRVRVRVFFPRLAVALGPRLVRTPGAGGSCTSRAWTGCASRGGTTAACLR